VLIIENRINVSRVINSFEAQTWAESNFVSNSYNTLRCRWKYDFATNHFTLDHEWLCSDKDPNNPYVKCFPLPLHAGENRYLHQPILLADCLAS
jgi:hypothetical protein